MSERWEYKVGGVTNGTHEMEQNVLNQEGKEGWELVSVLYHAVGNESNDDTTYFFYLKRRLPDVPLPPAKKKK